jgi:predicted MFS family arabinose efflux permease
LEDQVTKRTVAAMVLIVAAFMDLMDAMITNVALPAIQRDLDASAAQLEWTLTGYVLAFAALMVTGGRLGDIYGRRSVFVINVPVGALLVLATLRFVPDTRAERPLRLDITGVAIATAGLLLLVVPLVQGREHGWPAWAWVMLAAVPAVLVLFVRQQARREAAGAAPLVPTRLFARRGFAAGLVVQLAFHLGWGSFALVFGLYVQQALGFTPLEMGLTMVPITVGAFAGTAIAAPLAARGGRGLVLLGGLAQALAIAWYALVVAGRGAELSGWDLAWPLGLSGVGMILLAVPLMDVTLAAVDADDAGAASGVFNTAQQLGSALGLALVGVVFFGVLGDDPSPARYEDALVAGAWVTITAFALASVAGTLLPARRHPAPGARQGPSAQQASVLSA